MGLCLEEFGRVSVEVRRGSFVVHTDYDYPQESPEYNLEDIDPLIDALLHARRHLVERRGWKPRL